MKHQHVLNCSFSSWYPNFKRDTFKSRIIQLPVEFINYLNADRIVLPGVEETSYSNDLNDYSDEEDCNELDDQEGWDSAEVLTAPSFTDLKQEVDAAIKELGGAVMPKLNWSAPRDAGWITRDGTLCCHSFNDVCLLLKSSDFVSHDLNEAYEHCEDDTMKHSDEQFELILRKWEEILPGMEFRCFVKSNVLVGISQRQSSSFYKYLLDDQAHIFESIVEFFDTKVKDKFADKNFVVDVYRYNNDTLKIVDFNPFGQVTDSLLFSWKELIDMDEQNFDDSCESIFRVVTDENGIQPSPYLSYGLPTDALSIASGGEINKIIEFFQDNDLLSKTGEFEKS